MEDKYCDCGDPFQIHESNDPRCSKVRGVDSHSPVTSILANTTEKSDLLNLAKKVSSLAHSLSGVMTVLGILTIIGGVIIAFQSSSIDLGGGYGMTSHPYISLGVILAISGVLQILVFRLIFNYIEMQARYREWTLSK